jgi:hypothetical protein
MSSPVAVKAPDQEPDEAISGLKPGTVSRSEGDLKLMSEEQVLEHEVVPAAEDLAEGREEEAGKFEHPHRLVDPAARVLPPYGRCGFDWVLPRHPARPDRLRPDAADAGGAERDRDSSPVRCSWNHPPEIMKALDAGADCDRITCGCLLILAGLLSARLFTNWLPR